MRRDLFFFGGGEADGNSGLKELLGGKGAYLAEMARLGLPVPPGFTISTEACVEIAKGGGRITDELRQALGPALARVERIAGARFGDADAPLLVSVRSGARISMPGMMDTVLDLGLNDVTVAGLARVSGDRRFAYDAYRRFCAMYGSVVLGMGSEVFDTLLFDARRKRSAASDLELGAADLEELARACQRSIRAAGFELPQDPFEQLVHAIEAVFRSWENPRAVAYRQLNGIPGSWGTAVTVQAMVYGNLGQDSGTGVAFSRDPATGARELCGEFLAGAQGEDVVAGVRTPLGIAELEQRFPEAYRELQRASERLEQRFRDLQDIEFTVERGKLWVLQCRSGKRSGIASIRIAVEMAEEGLLTREEAVAHVEPAAVEQVLKPVFDPSALSQAIASGELLGRGLPAGPGAATGQLCLTASEAERRRALGERVILVRRETSAEDIRGMNAAEGLCTARGGMTSHAALVARQMGKVAVVGCGALTIDEVAGAAVFATAEGERRVREGEWISLDGFGGAVIAGAVATRPSEVIEVLVQRTRAPAEAPIFRRFAQLLTWADAIRTLEVRANADQADQAAVARALGAQGIGLARTEHMFFGAARIGPMREMILAETEDERRAALAKLLPLQRQDFAALFRTMAGTPVTIRTLDPPLHEFLPRDEAGIAELALATRRSPDQVRRRIAALAETNPMLGLRGCRLGILHPEITEMQARAIFEAACDVAGEGLAVDPRIMIPLVGERRELEHQAQVVRSVAAKVFAERGRSLGFLIGTMIEIPRAALTASEIAQAAEFFSFGTNDLTQTTLGLSRDDVGVVLPLYLERGIYPSDPFASLDREGVGELMRIAKERGRAARPDLELGICGEHGGDPKSIAFCHELGLDYVSCSPYRVPVARLAAAHAALAAKAR